ncbi:hypothetical protein [Roseateles terrae]|uniref:Uncharacterized protein n=1 Tax=Roseateles terrae TaxID=431060 RepID=A0ABR6GV88_9BURK|nr:hypothetical protein [Roseateles terrae]MBB3195984.1 hypothetical protein [Roseateles terrae]
MRFDVPSPSHAQLVHATQVLQDLLQPETLSPEALSPHPAASAQAMSEAMHRLTEPPSRELARNLFLLARDEQKHLAQATERLGPVLRDTVAERLRMHERLEGRIERWLRTEAFRGDVPRLMQGALIQHLQSTQAMGRLLQEVDHSRLAGVMLRWQVTHNAIKLALCNAPPGDETRYYHQRLATLLGAFNRCDKFESCQETLDTLWACLSAFERHKTSHQAAAIQGQAPRKAVTGPSALAPAGELDLGRDLDLASISKGHSLPTDARHRRLPALLERPLHRSTADLLQPRSDLERTWRQLGTDRAAPDSTDL